MPQHGQRGRAGGQRAACEDCVARGGRPRGGWPCSCAPAGGSTPPLLAAPASLKNEGSGLSCPSGEWHAAGKAGDKHAAAREQPGCGAGRRDGRPRNDHTAVRHLPAHAGMPQPRQRGLCAGDSTQQHVKSLDVVLGAETAVLIVDDTAAVWPLHAANLLQACRPAAALKMVGFWIQPSSLGPLHAADLLQVRRMSSASSAGCWGAHAYPRSACTLVYELARRLLHSMSSASSQGAHACPGSACTPVEALARRLLHSMSMVCMRSHCKLKQSTQACMIVAATPAWMLELARSQPPHGLPPARFTPAGPPKKKKKTTHTAALRPPCPPQQAPQQMLQVGHRIHTPPSSEHSAGRRQLPTPARARLLRPPRLSRPLRLLRTGQHGAGRRWRATSTCRPTWGDSPRPGRATWSAAATSWRRAASWPPWPTRWLLCTLRPSGRRRCTAPPCNAAPVGSRRLQPGLRREPWDSRGCAAGGHLPLGQAAGRGADSHALQGHP